MQTDVFESQVNATSYAALHLQLHIQKLIACVVLSLRQQAAHNDDLASVLASATYLHEYEKTLLQLGDDSLDVSIAMLDDDINALEQQSKIHLPLKALRETLQLERSALLVFLAAGLVEIDVRFGSLFARLQDPLVARAPCIGLLNWLLSPYGVDVWSTTRNLYHHGYIEYVQHGAIRSEWLLRIPSVIWDALHDYRVVSDVAGLRRYEAHDFPAIDELILTPEQHQTIAKLPTMLDLHGDESLVLRGMRGSGRRTIFGAVARALGRGIIVAENFTDSNRKVLGALATLTGALPLIRCQPNPGETITLNTLAGYRGVIGIMIGRTGGLDGRMLDNSVTVQIEPPGADLRRRFWQASEAMLNADEQDAIVKRFLLSGGTIHRVARRAQKQATLHDRADVGMADVQAALRTLNLQALETLATPLQGAGGWDRLVVAPALREELRVLAMRCRERETLQASAGVAFTNNLNRGVRALLSGESGTGKTLAARVLASELGMDIFRVDLSAVVNKYIGETERNLNEVFSRAEELDVLLLLDEGDSLLTQRTDVSTSNDRYANLETNYLLQRLEQYDGIVLITTNAIGRIDEAFMRRFDVIIEFAFPEAEERFALFHLHLPHDQQVSERFLHQVAYRCRLSGGQIRNVALHAMLLGIDDKAPVDDTHLQSALQTIYRREGMVYPFTQRSRANGR